METFSLAYLFNIGTILMYFSMLRKNIKFVYDHYTLVGNMCHFVPLAIIRLMQCKNKLATSSLLNSLYPCSSVTTTVPVTWCKRVFNCLHQATGDVEVGKRLRNAYLTTHSTQVQFKISMCDTIHSNEYVMSMKDTYK